MQISPPPGADTMLLRSIEDACRAARLYGVSDERLYAAVMNSVDISADAWRDGIAFAERARSRAG